MTFQVGLVGTDGIVLASDTKYRVNDPVTQFRSTDDAKKINIMDDGRFAYCLAGGNWANLVMERFLRPITEIDSIRERLDLSCKAVFQQSTKDQQDDPFWRGSILLIERERPSSALWHVDYKYPPEPRRILTKKSQGDTGNPAQFFLERYFQEGRTTQELLFLAAVCVLMAHELNPGGIDGLEILVSGQAGFEMIPQDQLRLLKLRFKELDAEISASLGPRNRNGQILIRKTSEKGNHPFANIWILRCSVCRHEYQANSCDFHERQCPKLSDHTATPASNASD